VILLIVIAKIKLHRGHCLINTHQNLSNVKKLLHTLLRGNSNDVTKILPRS